MRNFLEEDERANEEDFMWTLELFLKRVLIFGYLALCGITLFVLVSVEVNVECLANSESDEPISDITSNYDDVSTRFFMVLIFF